MQLRMPRSVSSLKSAFSYPLMAVTGVVCGFGLATWHTLITSDERELAALRPHLHNKPLPQNVVNNTYAETSRLKPRDIQTRLNAELADLEDAQDTPKATSKLLELANTYPRLFWQLIGSPPSQWIESSITSQMLAIANNNDPLSGAKYLPGLIGKFSNAERLLRSSALSNVETAQYIYATWRNDSSIIPNPVLQASIGNIIVNGSPEEYTDLLASLESDKRSFVEQLASSIQARLLVNKGDPVPSSTIESLHSAEDIHAFVADVAKTGETMDAFLISQFPEQQRPAAIAAITALANQESGMNGIRTIIASEPFTVLSEPDKALFLREAAVVRLERGGSYENALEIAELIVDAQQRMSVLNLLAERLADLMSVRK